MNKTPLDQKIRHLMAEEFETEKQERKQKEKIKQKSCLVLVKKLEKYMENPDLKYREISSIGDEPNFENYNTDCDEFRSFMENFNEQHTKAKISSYDHQVTHINGGINKMEKIVIFALSNRNAGNYNFLGI